MERGYKAAQERLVKTALEGNAWQADHIVPVYRGGGLCGLENLRTLCTPCHQDVTKQQARDRAAARCVASAPGALRSRCCGLRRAALSISRMTSGTRPCNCLSYMTLFAGNALQSNEGTELPGRLRVTEASKARQAQEAARRSCRL